MNLGPKIPYLVIFRLQFNKNYYQIFNRYSGSFVLWKFHPKQKNNYFVQKLEFLNLEPKMPYLGVLKNYFLFRNQRPRICLTAKFSVETKILKFGTKNAFFRYFWTGIWKQYRHVWYQHPRICLISKFREKVKMPKFGTKNVLFRYFWAEIWKQYCHIWNQHPQICPVAKFQEKTKMTKFGTKNALFGYVWDKF